MYVQSNERSRVRVGLPVRFRLTDDSKTYIGHIEAIARQPTVNGYVARVRLVSAIPSEESIKNARVLVVLSQTRLLPYLVNKARTFIRF